MRVETVGLTTVDNMLDECREIRCFDEDGSRRREEKEERRMIGDSFYVGAKEREQKWDE